jgi:hypothetical protein
MSDALIQVIATVSGAIEEISTTVELLTAEEVRDRLGIVLPEPSPVVFVPVQVPLTHDERIAAIRSAAERLRAEPKFAIVSKNGETLFECRRIERALERFAADDIPSGAIIRRAGVDLSHPKCRQLSDAAIESAAEALKSGKGLSFVENVLDLEGDEYLEGSE